MKGGSSFGTKKKKKNMRVSLLDADNVPFYPDDEKTL